MAGLKELTVVHPIAGAGANPASACCPDVPVYNTASPLVEAVGPVGIAEPLPARALLLVTVEAVAATGIWPAVIPERPLLPPEQVKTPVEARVQLPLAVTGA